MVEAATAAPHPGLRPTRGSPEPPAHPQQARGPGAGEQITRVRGLPHLVRASMSSARASEHERHSFEPMPPSPSTTSRRRRSTSRSPGPHLRHDPAPTRPLRGIRRATGTTLNDVYLTVCAGALRPYLADRGELPHRPAGGQRPVSTDSDAARMSGNRVDNIYVAIGTDTADPAMRLAPIHDGVGPRRRCAACSATTCSSSGPTWYRPSSTSRPSGCGAGRTSPTYLHPPLNLILSNVAGPREPIHIGPVVLEALYSVGPILEGIGCNITAWSYGDELGVSLHRLPESLPDPWALVDHLHGALGDLGKSVADDVPVDR